MIFQMDSQMTDSRILGNPGTPAFQIDKYPFYLLNRLVSRYNQVIGLKLDAIGLDIPSWRVLMILGTGSPQSVKVLADKAVIKLPTMTRITQRLSEASLVECRRSRADSRVTEVFLTSFGEEKLAAARKATAPVYLEVIEGYSESRFDRLTGTLAELYDKLSEFEP